MAHIIRYVLIILTCVAGLLLVRYNYPAYDLGNAGWILLGFLTVVYALAGIFIRAGEKGAPGVFVRRFMGATSIRLFLFMVVIVAYAFTHRTEAVSFILHFMVMYFLFTAVEVSAFYTRLSSKR